jgi:uncharacterized protein
MKLKFIFDTNALISSALSPKSTNAEALKLALELGDVLISDETWKEFESVLFRAKFDPYFSIAVRRELLKKFQFRFKKELITTKVTICRDSKDNMFLSLALSSQANALISGDNDLLILHPFEKLEILTAREFISKYQ